MTIAHSQSKLTEEIALPHALAANVLNGNEGV